LQKNLLLKIGFGTKTSLDEALWVETGFMQTISRETKFLSNKSTAENHTQNPNICHIHLVKSSLMYVFIGRPCPCQIPDYEII
jgi:hypothetical protein